MLRKLCQERPSDQDCYLPEVLFAHTEVPHENARFSLFQLLHWRTASGPVSILEERYFLPCFRQENSALFGNLVVDHVYIALFSALKALLHV